MEEDGGWKRTEDGRGRRMEEDGGWKRTEDGRGRRMEEDGGWKRMQDGRGRTSSPTSPRGRRCGGERPWTQSGPRLHGPCNRQNIRLQTPSKVTVLCGIV